MGRYGDLVRYTVGLFRGLAALVTGPTGRWVASDRPLPAQEELKKLTELKAAGKLPDEPETAKPAGR